MLVLMLVLVLRLSSSVGIWFVLNRFLDCDLLTVVFVVGNFGSRYVGCR